MAVLDCDLSISTKTDKFLETHPKSFFQGGIAEHNAAVVTGALSLAGVAAWWGEFAMFGVAESYNQQRLNDINGANVKLAVTHSGIDVGEDGKTHHSIDYFALLNSTFGWKVLHAGRSEPDRPRHALDGDASREPRARHGALEDPGRAEGGRDAVLRGRLRLRSDPRRQDPRGRRPLPRLRRQHAALRAGSVERPREGRNARRARIRGRVERPFGLRPRARRAARAGSSPSRTTTRRRASERGSRRASTTSASPRASGSWASRSTRRRDRRRSCTRSWASTGRPSRRPFAKLCPRSADGRRDRMYSSIPTDPATIVIFGGSGDLSKRKLVPALFELHREKQLPPATAIVGYARTGESDETYRAEMKAAVAEFARTKPVDEAVWNEFASRLYFYARRPHDSEELHRSQGSPRGDREGAGPAGQPALSTSRSRPPRSASS